MTGSEETTALGGGGGHDIGSLDLYVESGPSRLGCISGRAPTRPKPYDGERPGEGAAAGHGGDAVLGFKARLVDFVVDQAHLDPQVAALGTRPPLTVVVVQATAVERVLEVLQNQR